jgi:hypothetical protein
MQFESGTGLMKIPKDQDLALTVFLSISLFVVLLFWIFLPANIQLHDEEAEAIKVLKPDEAVFAVGEILTQAEESVARLEEEAEEKEGDQTEGGKK